MWKSIGDKFEIEPHDEQKHPRKVKTNTYLLFILILVFVSTRYTFREKMIGLIGNADIYNMVILAICGVCFLLTLMLFLFKYFKNKKEIDLFLLCISIFLLLFITNY